MLKAEIIPSQGNLVNKNYLVPRKTSAAVPMQVKKFFLDINADCQNDTEDKEVTE